MKFAVLSALLAGARGAEVLGYLENWNDVIWWDNGIPNNCVQGCFDVQAMINKTTPYSAVNYGFVFFSQQPTPNQNGCAEIVNKTTGKVLKTSVEACPVWDGKALYMSSAEKDGSHAVDEKTDIQNMTAGLTAIAEVVRLGRMHPAGPKRTKITLGGWSDFARLGSVPNAQKAAALAAKMVQFTFADGIDIDLEHLIDQSKVPVPWHIDEFQAWASFIGNLRKELDTVSEKWVEYAHRRKSAVLEQQAKRDPWTKGVMMPFVNTTLQYLDEVAANGAPHLEISWTTRFNAFVPKDDPYNYVSKWVGKRPDYNSDGKTFDSDNEGLKLWPSIAEKVDTVNIMAYDAANISFDFKKILSNFVEGGIPASKINLGLEPGEQLHEAIWEGMTTDHEVGMFIEKGGYAGAMLWGINPSDKFSPKAANWCPAVANMLSNLLKPQDRFEHLYAAPHKYTKADPKTGWLPKVAAHLGVSKVLNAKRGYTKGAPTRPSLSRPHGNRLGAVAISGGPHVLMPDTPF
jgi:hypothetical protein